MIKVTVEVNNYDDPQQSSMRVHSHWNEPSKVVLEVQGIKFTAVARDLEAAIKNATNTVRH